MGRSVTDRPCRWNMVRIDLEKVLQEQSTEMGENLKRLDNRNSAEVVGKAVMGLI